MSISYSGYNVNCATFKADGDIFKDDVVKMSANCTVTSCEEDDVFCGALKKKENDGCASVQLNGTLTTFYSGTAPSLGYCNLVADGTGGVKVATSGGRPYLIFFIDTKFNMIEFLL